MLFQNHLDMIYESKQDYFNVLISYTRIQIASNCAVFVIDMVYQATNYWDSGE